MKPKVLKNEQEYEAALEHVSVLLSAEPGSPKEEELELFSLLVEEYEERHFPIALPDPIEAIRFRMDQEGLTQKDLAQYMGSQSKVSEVLNGKRSLSLQMIRHLHEGLGIPAEVLLQEPGKKLGPVDYDWRDYPFAEMLKRGYFGEWTHSLRAAQEVGEELLAELFYSLGGESIQPVYCRRNKSVIDANALRAWQARVLQTAQRQELPEYKAGSLDDAFVKKLVRASYFDAGPALVAELLHERGVHFIVLEHLPKTYLDGAAFLTPAGRPVIGLTLRHDRLDNFWFTLLHEVAHVTLHLEDRGMVFFDETDYASSDDSDPREKEANSFARNALIPEALWQEVRAGLLASASTAAVQAVAERIEISPAIVAGRIRWESGDYKRFPDLIGTRRAGQAVSNEL